MAATGWMQREKKKKTGTPVHYAFRNWNATRLVYEESEDRWGFEFETGLEDFRNSNFVNRKRAHAAPPCLFCRLTYVDILWICYEL